jgi:hypothetical protein
VLFKEGLNIMKKRAVYFLAIVLALFSASLACNFSTQRQADSDKIATVEALETLVAATTTASASIGEATPIQAPEQPTDTPVAPIQVTEPAIPASGLDPTQIAALQATQAAGLDPTQMAGMDPTQIAALQATQAAGLNPTQMAGMDPTQIAALQATQAAGLNPTQMAALQATQIASSGLNPTQVAMVMQATQMAQGMSATQTAFGPHLSELSQYGVDPQGGQLGWFQPPLSVEVDQYRSSKFDNKYPLVKAKDFVMSADYTWDTQYGGSGCGFVFRSDGNLDAPNQYLVIASRLASGHVFFAVMAEGQLVVAKDFYANGLDPRFNSANGATNRLTVVGQGTTFTIYSNGTKLGDANPNGPLPPLQLPSKPVKPANMGDPVAFAAYQKALADYNALVRRLKDEYSQRVALWSRVNKDFESGYTGLGAMADSGRTHCDFDNAWLWLIGGPANP